MITKNVADQLSQYTQIPVYDQARTADKERQSISVYEVGPQDDFYSAAGTYIDCTIVIRADALAAQEQITLEQALINNLDAAKLDIIFWRYQGAQLIMGDDLEHATEYTFAAKYFRGLTNF